MAVNGTRSPCAGVDAHFSAERLAPIVRGIDNEQTAPVLLEDDLSWVLKSLVQPELCKIVAQHESGFDDVQIIAARPTVRVSRVDGLDLSVAACREQHRGRAVFVEESDDGKLVVDGGFCRNCPVGCHISVMMISDGQHATYGPSESLSLLHFQMQMSMWYFGEPYDGKLVLVVDSMDPKVVLLCREAMSWAFWQQDPAEDVG